MKSIFSFIIATLLSISAYSQNNAIEKFFSNYENNDDFTVVYVSPKMFQMVAKVTKDTDKAEISDLVKDVKGLIILTSENNSAKYYNEAIKKIPVSEYEVLLTVKEKNQNVRFLTKGTADVIDELLLLVGGADEFVLMSFVGKLDLNKIAKLAEKLDINGSEHLKKLENK